jgi:hypothetical protein
MDGCPAVFRSADAGNPSRPVLLNRFTAREHLTSETPPPDQRGRKPRARRPNNRCQVCRHDQRWRIKLLRAGGASLDALAQKFNVDRDAIWRHWHKHVTPEAKAACLAGPVSMEHLIEKAATEGDSVLDYLKIVRGSLLVQLSTMGVAGDSRNVGYIAGQLVKTLEAIARITGELGSLATSINITNNNNVAVLDHPDVARVLATLLRALAEFPDARTRAVDALRGLDSENARTGPAGPMAAPPAVIDHVA